MSLSAVVSIRGTSCNELEWRPVAPHSAVASTGLRTTAAQDRNSLTMPPPSPTYAGTSVATISSSAGTRVASPIVADGNVTTLSVDIIYVLIEMPQRHVFLI